MNWIKQLVKFCRGTVKAHLAENVDTHLLCQVVSYDEEQNLVNLQPCIKHMRVFDAHNMRTVQLPPINDVPVEQRGSGTLLMSVAPQPESYGYLHVSKHRLETWLTQGGIVEPGSAVLFDKNDGVFVPGVYPLITDGNNGALQSPIQTDRIGFRNRAGDKELTLDEDGVVRIVEGTDYAVQYTALKAAFDQLKSDFNTFVTVKYNLHAHTGVTTGPGTSAVTTLVGTSSAADMSGAKIEDIMVP